ncbi:gamma-glutamylcyclotransferase [Roseibium sp.]|uniref:gamma-glutamylcyclotransferase n=1 Tax=Roseibium sp. TaxID=1936156 RepID=UPI003A982D20
MQAPDPFRHHPNLRSKIQDPLTSRFRSLDLTDMDRDMQGRGFGPDWRRCDEDRNASRLATLEGRLDEDLWVFAYGSLMWDPAFIFSDIRRATATGFHRRFCLRSEVGRGTPEQPGLMAGLDVGGVCQGLVFKIDGHLVEEESHFLWRREMLMRSYAPEFLTLETAEGQVDALSFLVNRDNPLLLPPMGLKETARAIALAEGYLGPNIDYLENLANYFEWLGLDDAELFELRHLAREHRQMALASLSV